MPAAALRPAMPAPAQAERGSPLTRVKAPATGLWREFPRPLLLALADAAAASIALVVVLSEFRQAVTPVRVLVYLPVVIVLLKLGDLYDRDELHLAPSTLDEAPRVAQLTGLLALAMAILPSTLQPSGPTAGAEIGALWAALFVALLGGRAVARFVAERLCRPERCLCIGDLDHVERLRSRLAASRARARVIACLPLTAADILELDDAQFIGGVVRELDIDRIIIAASAAESGADARLVRIAKAAGARVTVLSDLFDAIGARFEFDGVNGMTMVGVRQFGISRAASALKRSFDVAATLIGLVVAGPLILAIAIAIRLDSKGPVFFRQVRVGRDGRPFSMVKFRSMVADADSQKEAFRALSEAGHGLFKITNDPRVTTVGRFLRRSSLDELPQIFNVLRGEMSLVGPRPLVVDEDVAVRGLDRSRLHLAPGMTGPWQILASRVPLDDMVAIDYRYVTNWSPWTDLKILLRTGGHMLGRGNQ